MTDSLSIAILHGRLSAGSDDQRIIYEQIRGLRARGHRVELYCTMVAGMEQLHATAPDIRIKRLVQLVPLATNAPNRFSLLLALVMVPVNALRLRRVQVFVGWNRIGAWLAYLFTRVHRRPYVVYQSKFNFPTRIRNAQAGLGSDAGEVVSEDLAGLPGLLGNVDADAIGHAAALLANGGAVADRIHSVYGIEPSVCVAGCRPHSRRVLRLDTPYVYDGAFKLHERVVEKPYLLVTGRYANLGQWEIVLRVLAQVTQEVPGAFLVLARGQPRDSAAIQRIARQQFVDDRFLITGHIAEPDLHRLYREAAVYCHLSPDDGSVLGVLEAMAWGVPVVAWNQASSRAVVENGKTGFLADEGNVAYFARAVAWLLQDPELRWRLGAAGWDRARRYFTWKHHLDVLGRALFLAADRAVPVPESVGPTEANGGAPVSNDAGISTFPIVEPTQAAVETEPEIADLGMRDYE